MLNGQLLQTIEERTLILSDSFKIKGSSLYILGSPTWEEWVDVGRYIHRSTESVHFLLGDWLRYGVGRWGEMYKKAAELTGFEEQTLKDDKSVAIMIPPERRKKELTFSHYRLITRFDEEEQDEYVEAAIKNKLNVRQFDSYIKEKEAISQKNTNQLSPRGDNYAPQPSSEVANKTENNKLTMDKALDLAEQLSLVLDEIDYEALDDDKKTGFIKKLLKTSRKIDGLWWECKEDDNAK